MQKDEKTEEVKTGESVKSQKTDKEFLDDLTTDAPAPTPDANGRVNIAGAFPQIKRKPVKDKTANGLERVTY